jgi:hypothetical protein
LGAWTSDKTGWQRAWSIYLFGDLIAHVVLLKSDDQGILSAGFGIFQKSSTAASSQSAEGGS